MLQNNYEYVNVPIECIYVNWQFHLKKGYTKSNNRRLHLPHPKRPLTILL